MKKLNKFFVGMGGLLMFGNIFSNGFPDNRVDTVASSWRAVGNHLKGAIKDYEKAQKPK